MSSQLTLIFGAAMHKFDPNLTIEENHKQADEIGFAAWEFAGHDHRETYRNSGRSVAKAGWLNFERIRKVSEALGSGELVALGVSPDDPNLAITELPRTLFLDEATKISEANSAISGLERNYCNVRICRAKTSNSTSPEKPVPNGRPSHLTLIVKAWAALKEEKPNFLNWDKGSQNREIQGKVAALNPGKFPGSSRIGATTIRRHRSKRPDLFQ